MTDAVSPPQLPAVKSITSTDIRDAIRAGLADFQKAPIYGLFFGAIFSIAGVAIVWALYTGEVSYWIFPAAAGFPRCGSATAVGQSVKGGDGALDQRVTGVGVQVGDQPKAAGVAVELRAVERT